MALAACGDDDDDSATGDTTADTGGGDPYGDNGTETTAPAGGGDTTGDTADAGGGGGGGQVSYQVSSIDYSDVTAPAGGTIAIENTSGAPHTFTADDGAFDVEYGADQPGTVDVPAEPGSYPFHCEIHPSMTATLTVQ
jgi:plastocyanin